MPELLFSPRRAEGPIGTGVHLLRLTQGTDGITRADAWLTFLFLPIVPFGEWIVERDRSVQSVSVVRHVRPARLLKSILWIVGGAVAAFLSLVPAYGALTFLMGSKIAELAGLFGSVGAIVGTLGWLDETRDRVPFWVALRAMASATRMR
jgi:hypothetical protein